jgi:hydroxymethylglutaryl-CoA lyase
MTGERVDVVEVAPRDGLQNEKVILPTERKLELIRRCVAAGARRVEAVSFVHPDRVPQMADAEAVMAGVDRSAGVSYAGLVLNVRGADRAVEAGVDELNYVVVATDAFGERNQGTTTEQALGVWPDILERARANGMRASITVGAAFGCPFEGEVSVDRVAWIAERIAAIGADEISLADTIGVGDPRDVAAKFTRVAEAAPGVVRRSHLHNTRNTGLANAAAAVDAGVTVFDASLGGIGGCPFAPAATGNIPTEDLVYMFDRMGIRTGIDLGALMPSAPWIGEQLGKAQVPGMLSRAGMFPAAA